MALNLVIIDTCVFIKAFRGDKTTAAVIKSLEGQIAYSYITYLELLAGCKTIMRKKEITGLFDTFYEIPDCLIAASQIITGFPLFTYNTKDFKFFENIHLLDLKNHQK